MIGASGQRPQPPRPTLATLAAGPFRGVRDSLDPADADPTLLTQAGNLYAPFPDAPLETRPPWGARTMTGAATLSWPPSSYQWIGQHTYVTTAGVTTEATYFFAGGKMYRLDFLTEFSTPDVATDITPGAITISSTARIHGVTFANKLIVTDGVNKMWAYDAETATATTITITAGGAAADQVVFGKPTVRSAKLVVIRNNARTMIQWSEEGDPFTGYDQTGFVNHWVLEQTNSEPLEALQGTNACLFYWRGEAIGMILGEIETDFATTSTHDAVSTSVGCKSCETVVEVGRDVWFLDRAGRPYLLDAAGVLTPLWKDCRQTMGTYTSTSWTRGSTEAWGAYLPFIETVVFGTRSVSAGILYAFHAPTRRYLGSWSVSTATDATLGAVIRPQGKGYQPCLIVVNGGAVSTGTMLYLQADGSGTLTSDGATVVFTTPFLGAADGAVEYECMDASLLLGRGASGETPGFTITSQTPRGAGSPLAVTGQTGGAGYGDRPVVVGTTARGRWVRFTVTSIDTVRFRLDGLRIRAAVIPVRPDTV